MNQTAAAAAATGTKNRKPKAKELEEEAIAASVANLAAMSDSEVTQVLQSSVREYGRILSDQIAMDEKSKALNKRKKVLGQQYIMPAMKRLNKRRLDLGEGRMLELETKERRPAVTLKKFLEYNEANKTFNGVDNIIQTIQNGIKAQTVETLVPKVQTTEVKYKRVRK